MSLFVLWDLDGTLVDSGEDIVSAANQARVALGFGPLPEALVRSYVGEGAPRLMQNTMGLDAPASLHEAGLQMFLRFYEQKLIVRTRPYEGIDALVRSLSGRQAVVTNKPGPFARRIVEHFGWSPHFVSVLGAGDVAEKKPAPDMVRRALEEAGVRREEAILVGDTTIDIATAKAAGVDMVAVGWGLRPGEDLSEAPRRVEKAEELARLLGV